VKTVRPGDADPLLEPARSEGTAWFVHGNRALVSLNVAGAPATATALDFCVACSRLFSLIFSAVV
jgi:hypothetical protein